MSRVLLDNVWVSGRFFAIGMSRDDIEPEVSGRIGDHLWGSPTVRPNLDASGAPLSGLLDNVWVDGTLYPMGSTPPPQVAAKIGGHLWVDGVGPALASDVDAQTPATTDAPSPAASVVDPATLDGSLMGQLDEEPDDAVDPDGDAQSVAEVVLTHVPPGPDAEPVGTLTADGGVEVPVYALPDPLPPEPPRAGRGASRKAWADYAAALFLNTTEDMKLADIIVAVDAHLAQFGPDGRG